MTDFIPPSVRAFVAHEARLRAMHGPLTLVVRPQSVELPRAPRGGVVIGGWAFLDGEPAVMPEGLDLIVLTVDGPDGLKTFPRSPASVLEVLARHVTRHAEPCPHLALRVPERKKADLIARIISLPDHDGVSASKKKTLFPVLKEPGWAHRDLVVHTRLHDHEEAPLLAFAEDLPKGYVFLTRQDAPKADVRALLAEAIGNLSQRPFDLAEISRSVAASAGSDLSAERILDPGFLRVLHERLGPEVWVAIPHRVALYALGAAATADEVSSFVAIVGFELERGPGSGHAPVSRLVFRVVSGGIATAVPLESLADAILGNLPLP